MAIARMFRCFGQTALSTIMTLESWRLLVKVGDVVAPRPGNVFGPSEERKNGIIIDSYEDEYGIAPETFLPVKPKICCLRFDNSYPSETF